MGGIGPRLRGLSPSWGGERGGGMEDEKLAVANRYDLTAGGVLGKLAQVALPLIGSQLIQMVYNLTDMFWLGRMGQAGGAAVAASGSVGLYLWLSMAFSAFGARGAEIGVAQDVGRGERDAARSAAQSAYTLAALLGLGYMAFLLTLNGPLIGFLNLRQEVEGAARGYLVIVACGVPFSFVSAAATGIFSGSGNSRTPFLINCVSLGLNMTLDPLLIFGLGLGVHGAAYATAFAQTVSALLLTRALMRSASRPFESFRPLSAPRGDDLRLIFSRTLPIALESLLFTGMSMLLTRLLNAYGTDVTAAMSVGSQAESLSWLIGGGFASAMTAFTGQNFGALRWRRIRRGFRLSALLMGAWGVAVTLVLYFGGERIFRLFMPDNDGVVRRGVEYLKILAFSQFFQCLEGIAAGAFRGLGRTVPPFITSAVPNLLRLIAAMLLSRGPMGLIGIYWAVAVGAALRGLWICLWYLRVQRRLPTEDGQPLAQPA